MLRLSIHYFKEVYIKIYIDIEEGDKIPLGYGVAWRAYSNRKIRCYLIPINILVRALKDLYYYILRGCWRSKWEEELISKIDYKRRKCELILLRAYYNYLIKRITDKYKEKQ